MGYELRRITKEPATVLKIQVDQRQAGEDDGGFQAGGYFEFSPAGTDGDRYPVSEHAARVIMSDPGQAHHFECTPALDSKAKKAKAQAGAVVSPDAAATGEDGKAKK
jgi:hypothetical protein